MVDALDSKSGIRKGVRVRVPSPAMKETQLKGRVSFFHGNKKRHAGKRHVSELLKDDVVRFRAG